MSSALDWFGFGETFHSHAWSDASGAPPSP